MKKELITKILPIGAVFIAITCLYSAIFSDVSVIQWNRGKRRMRRSKGIRVLLASSIAVKILLAAKLNQIDGLGEVYRKCD